MPAHYPPSTGSCADLKSDPVLSPLSCHIPASEPPPRKQQEPSPYREDSTRMAASGLLDQPCLLQLRLGSSGKALAGGLWGSLARVGLTAVLASRP